MTVQPSFVRILNHDGQISVFGSKSVELTSDPVREREANSYNCYGGWTVTGQTLTFSADRTGVLPIYYYVSDTQAIVSNSLRKICAELDEVVFDQVGLASVLMLGYCLGDRTIISGVKRLQPGETARWQPRPILHDRYPSLISSRQSSPDNKRLKNTLNFSERQSLFDATSTSQLPFRSAGEETPVISLSSSTARRRSF